MLIAFFLSALKNGHIFGLCDACMAQNLLFNANLNLLFHQFGGKCVPQRARFKPQVDVPLASGADEGRDKLR